MIKKITNTIQAIYHEPGKKRIEEKADTIETNNKYTQAIVVLTNGLVEVLRPNSKKKIKTTSIGHIRYAAAAQLYKQLQEQGEKPIIIASGGNIHDKDNDDMILSEVMKKELEKYHIPTHDIITENQSIDTSQNAKYSTILLEKLGIQPEQTTVITNDFHIERSQKLFEKYYGNISGASAENILLNADIKPNNHYKKLITERMNSTEQEKLAKTDKTISTIYKLPWGEKLIEMLATYKRQGIKHLEQKIPDTNK